MSEPLIEELRRDGGPPLAYRRRTGRGNGVGVVWFCGFNSDMDGTKAVALDAWAEREKRAFVRFDYFGHGRSGGDFRDGGVSQWLADALDVLDGLTEGRQLFVGSSMGAWIALLAARARPEKAAALLLVAPAPDFTARLTWPRMTDAARAAVETEGEWLAPSAYGEPVPFTRKLFEDGKAHLVLDAPYTFSGPTHILQGTADPDVPWSHALMLAETMTGGDVALELIKGGDHRLSTDQDLRRLSDRAAGLCARVDETRTAR